MNDKQRLAAAHKKAAKALGEMSRALTKMSNVINTRVLIQMTKWEDALRETSQIIAGIKAENSDGTTEDTNDGNKT